MLRLHDVSVTYPDGTPALKHLSLTVAAGESVALIGANGAGKTSLIMAIAGVLPASGEIYVDGICLGKKTLPDVRAKLGVVFQDPDDQLFMPTMFDDAAFGLRNAGVPEVEVRARVEACFAQLGISRLRDKTALRLSGGEKRMAALATALITEPSLLLLDEPGAFLDPKARRSLIRQLNALRHTRLIATHDMAFASESCERVILLKEGALFADGPAALLFDQELMENCGVEAIGTYMSPLLSS